MKNAEKGIAGMPLYLRYGGQYKVGPINWAVMVCMKEKLMWKDTFTFPVNDNVKLSVTGVMDM